MLLIKLIYPLLFPDSTLIQVVNENPRLLSTLGRLLWDTKLFARPENFSEPPNCPVAGASVVIEDNPGPGEYKIKIYSQPREKIRRISEYSN